MTAMRKIVLGLVATATLVAGMAPASAALARTDTFAPPVAQDVWNHGGGPDRGDWRDGRGGYGRPGHDYRGDYRNDYRGDYRDGAYRGQSWRGNDGRYYCRRNDGTTGLLVGGVAGAVVGQGVAGRGDRTLGAILGAAGGALLGKAIDQSNARCR